MIKQLKPTEIYLTNGVNSLIQEGILEKFGVIECITRFNNLDFGELSELDAKYQLKILKDDNKNLERLMGVYEVNGIKIWEILDYYSREKKVLTVLLPEEY